MSDKKYTALNQNGIILLLLIILTLLLFQVKDTYHLTGLLMLSCLVVVPPLSPKRWSQIDWIIAIIVIYNIISCLYSSCTIPSVRIACSSVMNLAAYWVIRRLFTEPHIEDKLFLGSIIPISFALAVAVCTFFVFRNSVLNAGFTDTYHFRFLFRPLGYITNIWSEILLILLGWSCIIRRYSFFLIFLSLLGILLSFSRGAYIALGVYLLIWLLWIKPFSLKFKLLLPCVIALAVTSIYFPIETKTTLGMNVTYSQQQSTEGRLNALSATKEIVTDFWFGQGNESYPLAIDKKVNQDSTKSYTSIAPNIIVQILIEKGIVGVSLYLVLAISIVICIWKQKKDMNVRIVACAMLALSIKEMTQATFLSCSLMTFLMCILLAYIQKNRQDIKQNNKTGKGIPILIGSMWTIFLCFITFEFVSKNNSSLCQESFKQLRAGNIEEAVSLIEKTDNRLPHLIEKGIFYTVCFQKTKEQKYFHCAEQTLNKAYQLQPEDVHILYLKAHLYSEKKENDKAITIMESLVENYPKNSLYLLTLSEIYYVNGNKRAALNHLFNSTLYTPPILEMQFIRELKQTDPSFYFSLCHKLSEHISNEPQAPTDLARMGYIAHWLNQQTIAKKYLEKAVAILPNLTTPWLLLGENKKYNLLNQGAFRKIADDKHSMKLPNITKDDLLKRAYQAKFCVWYGEKLEEVLFINNNRNQSF